MLCYAVFFLNKEKENSIIIIIIVTTTKTVIKIINVLIELISLMQCKPVILYY